MKHWAKGVLLAVCLAALTGADFLGPKELEKSQSFGGQPLQITVFQSEQSQQSLSRVLDDAFAVVREVLLKTSTAPGSLLHGINHAQAGQTFELDADTYAMLREALRIAKLSGGAYDLNDDELRRIWNEAKYTGIPPGDSQISAALGAADYRAFELNPNKSALKVLKEGARISLTSVAKGYALDRAADFLRKSQVRSAVLNFGGDLEFLGLAPDRAQWRIGIEHPRKLEEYAAVLKLPEAGAVATAGDYEDFFVYQGTRYPHILDPRTGRPGKSGVTSVTIIAKNALLANIVSRAFFVLGPEKGFELVDSLAQDGVRAVCIQEYEKNKFALSLSDGAQNWVGEVFL